MTAPQGTTPGTASPERIRRSRHVTAMAALDTVDLLAERVLNLLTAGRRITIARRWTHVDDPHEVITGLTVDGDLPTPWRREHGAGLSVDLTPGLNSFGFAAYAPEATTEAEAWRQYHAMPSDRRNLTQVTVNGGLPGDSPARDDHLRIRHWNQHGTCRDTVVAFDYHTGPAALRAARDELADHLANLSDQQPWANKAMFERLLVTLNAEAGVAPVAASREAGR